MGAAAPPNAAAPAIVLTTGRPAVWPAPDGWPPVTGADVPVAAAIPAAGRLSAAVRAASRTSRPRWPRRARRADGDPAARPRADLRGLGSMALLTGTARRPPGAPPL